MPFILLHKTGFTSEFIDLNCISVCHSGIIFHSCEAVITKLRWERYTRRKQKYYSLVQKFQLIHCEAQCPKFKDFDTKTLPSDDLIAKCFLAKFLEDETKYRLNIFNHVTLETQLGLIILSKLHLI